MENLKKHASYAGAEGPVVLVIMDGVGIGKNPESDCVAQAKTPNLNWLKEHAVYTEIKAHGKAVGLPEDTDMGNSEVGHNAIGCGRVFDQGASLIDDAISSRALFEGVVWNELVENTFMRASTLHFIGLLSDGKVHSNINHLEAMLLEAKARGVKNVRIHALTDGRDVPPVSALDYVERLETFLSELSTEGIDYCIASGGGRMKITMDRYDADWPMIERGWQTHVRGEGRQFPTMQEAIETFRSEQTGILDQDLPAFVIERAGEAVGPVVDGDSVVLFNYRGDRALELTKAFEANVLNEFERGAKPDVIYAGMMQYDGDLGVPENFLVCPPAIDRTMSEYLSNAGVRQFAISETQKYGHVTYFFNGNNSSKFETETWMEILSDNCPFEEKPRMQADPITDEAVKVIESGLFDFVRINYPNGDMVGHTGVIPAVIESVEAVDEGVGRLMNALKKVKGVLICSADHGNSDDMVQLDKKTNELMRDTEGQLLLKTAHSLNPVPVYIYDPAGTAHANVAVLDTPGVSSLAATSITMLGFEPPEGYTPSLVNVG
ncbi:MAG: 2,3-bisphosphoglycerate-independent phosphoglycerate mutase [Pontiellaceae bacterium]